MKNTLFALLLMVSGFSLVAQVQVSEGSKTMVEGTYNAYTVDLENAKVNIAEDVWKDFMKEFKAKVKEDKKAKIHFSDNVQMPDLSSNPVDVYASISGGKGEVTSVNVWFDTGSGYVNSIDMKAQSEIASKLIAEYGNKVMKRHSEDMQKEEEGKLKEFMDDSKKLENKNKDLRNDIAKAKENIMKWEKELSQNEDDLKKKGKDIEKQEKKVSEAVKITRKY